MSGPVLWGVPAIDGEVLMSLVTRTVARNILPSSHLLLRQVGASHANNPTAALVPHLDEIRLATILRQPTVEIARRRYMARPEPGFVDSFGVAVRADEIVFRRRRFAPTAMGASVHCRALWSLKMVPCCTENWEYLIDTCACGAVQRWQHANRLDRCDVCNGQLTKAPAQSVDPALRDSLGFMIGLLDPDEGRRNAARAQLPRALAEWDGGMVFELAMAMMPLTESGYTPKRGHEPPASEASRYAASLAEVAVMVRHWPHSLVEALTDCVKHRALSKRNVRYKGTAHYFASLSSELLPRIVRDAISQALAAITSPAGTTPPDQIGMREAALLTGHEEHALAIARRSGQLKTRICLRSNRLLPTLDREEVERLARFFEKRVGLDAASQRLHLPQYAMAQLAEEGLITLEDHPYVVARYGGRQLHEAELIRFQRRLQRGGSVANDIQDPVPLHRVARALGGGPKPWGTIIRSLIDRDIPYSIDRASIDRISISGEDAEALRLMDLSQSSLLGSGHISQRDAAEILNLPLKHAHVLSRSSASGGPTRIAWRRVRRLALTRVTLAELSARTGIHGTRLKAKLVKDGCFRHDALGWNRRKALAQIATY